MIYICTDVRDENDDCRCKNEEQRYNQCCQNCVEVRTCRIHCDYAHWYNCAAKEEIEE